MSSQFPSSYVPRFAVTVGGEEFHDYSGHVPALTVDTTTDGADYVTMSLSYPFDHEQVSFDDLPWDTFETGTEIEVEMGYGDSTETVFVGEIDTIEAVFPENGTPTVQVSGFGPLQQLMTGTNSRSWEESSLQTVVDDVAGDHFGTVTVEDADLELELVMQDRQSDYQFLCSLADRYGFELFSTQDEFIFRPNAGGSAPDDPVATLYYGESLESFTSEISSAAVVGEVEVRHWDVSTNEEIIGSATGEGSAKHVYRIAVESEAEATDIAESKLETLGEEEIHGRAETFGVPEITAGVVVSLEGLGSTFTNNYYVTDATHRIGPSGYRTSFEVTGVTD